MSFKGFTDEEIQRQKFGQNLKPTSRRTEDAYGRKYLKARRRSDERKYSKNNLNKVASDIPEEAKLTMGNKKEFKPDILNVKQDDTQQNGVQNTSNLNQNSSVTLQTNKIEKKVIDLNEFQARQKYIEEQNRRRKEVLSKALADRTKQTEEEARRLREIQHEFKKLDELLSNDVAVLRRQIETASFEFFEAQKRYDRAEKEFLDAKLILHHKLEKKELLTEHLCAIIEKNEERKAEKLKELMNKLEVTDKEVKVEENQTMSDNENDVKIQNTAEEIQTSSTSIVIEKKEERKT